MTLARSNLNLNCGCDKLLTTSARVFSYEDLEGLHWPFFNARFLKAPLIAELKGRQSPVSNLLIDREFIHVQILRNLGKG